MASSLEEIPEVTPDSEVRETAEGPPVIGVVAESNPAENRVAATPATVSAPLIYFQLIAATVIGFLVFGDWPEPLTLLGLAVIFASGVGGLALVPRR